MHRTPAHRLSQFLAGAGVLLLDYIVRSSNLSFLFDKGIEYFPSVSSVLSVVIVFPLRFHLNFYNSSGNNLRPHI